jgi:hypothetical protein
MDVIVFVSWDINDRVAISGVGSRIWLSPNYETGLRHAIPLHREMLSDVSGARLATQSGNDYVYILQIRR